MSMRHPKIFHLFTVLISSTFLCSSSFGATPSSPQMSQGAQMTQESQWIEAGEEPVSIQETLERTYMQNTDLDAERANLRVKDEGVSQAVAGWRPSLSVEGTQSQTQNYPIGSVSRARGAKKHNSDTTYTATLSQNIYAGGATEAQIGAAESNVLSERANLFIKEQTSLFAGVQAHTAILANDAIVEYQKQNRDFYLKLLESAEAFFEVGQGGRVAVEEARGKYEQGIGDLALAIRDYENAKATYMQTVGSPPGKLAPANVIVQIPKDYEEALEIAKTHNPAITQARYQLEAAEYNVYLQAAGLLPSVDINGAVGNDRKQGTGITSGVARPGALKTTNLEFNATVKIPIYPKGGAQSSLVRQAYQEVAQAKVALVGAQRGVVSAVRTAWDNLISAREAVKGYLAQVKATELAVEGAFEEVKVGVTSVTDMIVIQQNLIQAQISLARAQQGLVDAGYEVLQAMGRLTARDLRLNVRYYDPDAYYNEYKNAWIQFWQGEDWRYVKDGDKR
jgi:outer membrane protein